MRSWVLVELFRQGVPGVVPMMGGYTETGGVNGTRVGYARCSTDKQDVIVQTEQLQALGVEPDRIYIDRGFHGALEIRNLQ